MIRFLLGGAIVTAFAFLGEIFRPKTFAGLFGAAPSVAIATLSLGFAKHGPHYVKTEAASMVVGAIALAIYSLGTMRTLQKAHLSPWLGAAALWLEWVALASFFWAVLFSRGAPW